MCSVEDTATPACQIENRLAVKLREAEVGTLPGVCVCMCVCAWAREKVRVRERESVCVREIYKVRVSVCARERERK